MILPKPTFILFFVAAIPFFTNASVTICGTSAMALVQGQELLTCSKLNKNS